MSTRTINLASPLSSNIKTSSAARARKYTSSMSMVTKTPALLIFYDLFSRLGPFSVLNLCCKDIRQHKLRVNNFDRASSDTRIATVLTALAWSRHRVGLIAESIIRVE